MAFQRNLEVSLPHISLTNVIQKFSYTFHTHLLEKLVHQMFPMLGIEVGERENGSICAFRAGFTDDFRFRKLVQNLETK